MDASWPGLGEVDAKFGIEKRPPSIVLAPLVVTGAFPIEKQHSEEPGKVVWDDP